MAGEKSVSRECQRVTEIVSHKGVPYTDVTEIGLRSLLTAQRQYRQGWQTHSNVITGTQCRILLSEGCAESEWTPCYERFRLQNLADWHSVFISVNWQVFRMQLQDWQFDRWGKGRKYKQTARHIKEPSLTGTDWVIKREEGALNLLACFYYSTGTVSHEEGGRSMWGEGITRKGYGRGGNRAFKTRALQCSLAQSDNRADVYGR